MGNKSSDPKEKEKTPFDILEIEPGSTKEEIRKAYLSMLLKYHPTRNKDSSDQKVIEIKDAYESLISGEYKPTYTLDLSLYTEEYFSKLQDNFYDSVDSFIKRLLVEEPEAEYPSFKSKNHKKFYDYFSKFKTQRSFSNDKVINKRLQDDFNERVRSIVELIKKYDNRLIKEIKRVDVIAKTKKKKIKKERMTEFNCEECKKGFKNVNQLINHLQSKKHCDKANWTEEKKEYEINKIKERIKNEEKTEEKEFDYFDEFDSKIMKNEKLLEDFYLENKKKESVIEEENKFIEENIIEKINEENIIEKINEEKIKNKEKNKIKRKEKKAKKKQKESDSLTKCTICNSKFDSRNKLFIHLNEVHNNKQKKKK